MCTRLWEWWLPLCGGFRSCCCNIAVVRCVFIILCNSGREMLVYWGTRGCIWRECSAQDVSCTRIPAAVLYVQDYLKKLLRPSIWVIVYSMYSLRRFNSVVWQVIISLDNTLLFLHCSQCWKLADTNVCETFHLIEHWIGLQFEPV